MKVISYKKVDGCLEGTNVYDYLLSDGMSKEYILSFKDKGKLVYRGDIAKPFFKLIVKAKYTMKGAQTKDIIRVIFPENEGDNFVDEVQELLTKD